MRQLSKRLRCIADRIPQGARVADIGTDHALLPVYLVTSGISPFCIGVEVNEGPFEAARKQIENSGLTDKISLRKGDGLLAVDSGEVDVVVIAGMGGALIRQILVNGMERLKGVKALLLQPNVDAPLLRRFGVEYGFMLVEEVIVEDGGEFYEILSFVPGTGPLPYQRLSLPLEYQWMFGPYLLQKKGEAFLKKWERELEKVEKILSSLRHGETEMAREKRRAFQKKREWIKEVLR